jgi:IS605 OrfB family transposase
VFGQRRMSYKHPNKVQLLAGALNQLMIRSSTLSLSSCNVSKLQFVQDVVVEYRRIAKLLMDEFWTEQILPKRISSTKLHHIGTFLSKSLVASVANQCLNHVRTTRKSAIKLKVQPSKPNTDLFNPELSNVFVRLDWNNETSFDCIMTLTAVRRDKKKIMIPLRSTKHLNKLKTKGQLRGSVRLTKKGITFFVDVQSQQNDSTGSLGIDIGIVDTVATSDNQRTDSDHHGHTLSNILQKLARRKRGSNGFRRAQTHRQNFINWSVNKINFDGVKNVVIENIKNMRRGKNVDRFRSGWTYNKIFNKIEQRCEELGVQVTRVSSRNTSRQCSSCGFIFVKNRKSKNFTCLRCGFKLDADLNAARNILFRGKESIVPCVKQQILTINIPTRFNSLQTH